MSVEEIPENTKRLVWDKPYFYYQGKIFKPKLYEWQAEDEKIPAGYNVISLKLDGKVTASLDWKKIEKVAENSSKEGFLLFWDLDLGLFDRLEWPLSNQTQFLSLLLSLEHFRDNLWNKFKDQTLGVNIYRGPVNFKSQMSWDDELQSNYKEWKTTKGNENDQLPFSTSQALFAREVGAEYLAFLANRMPDEMPIFVTLDKDLSLSLSLEVQLTHRERWGRLHLLVKNSELPYLFNFKPAPVGVCLPNYQWRDQQTYQELEEILRDLLNERVAFNIIPENYLLHEWEGLDYLVVISSSLTRQGKRNLQGFCAAGGTVITVGSSLGLAKEIPYVKSEKGSFSMMNNRDGE
ncbi:hypothetical protein NEOC84_001798|uniref:hypothetical protein n=1 Tax=Neochlamydia sp. AcF84 TaxID=2315858 RepID=UPI001409E078|nr:hypothetical protein [Neochlamydia sp. AcF84]NGY95869.1 hypothetical protein [Neochlamydia sp. AcF84]